MDTAAPFGTKTLAEAVKLKLARVLLFAGVVGLLDVFAVLAVIAGLFVALFDDPAADDGRRIGMAREAMAGKRRLQGRL